MSQACASRPTPSVEDIVREARENRVKIVRLQFVDIHGLPKNMSVHVDQLERALNNEVMLDGSSIAGFRTIETSDMYFYPDRSTFKVLPWTEGDRGIARLICDIYNPDGTPFDGCPRNNLKRVLAEAEKLGFRYNVGPELEFFLFERDENGNMSTRTHDAGGYYDLGPDDRGEIVRGEVVDTLEKMGFEIEADHHEVAHGQHEIDFKYGEALSTADNVTTVKIITRKIAADNGLHATFMPKPLYGTNGSGMHCNQSLARLDGANAFNDPNGDYQMSQESMWFIAGLLKHVRGFTAITNPTVNSYKRLVPGYEAPVYIAWSTANRSALLRVPAKRGNATRVELRSPDPSANPYLAFAVMLMAGLDGVKNKLEPAAPLTANIYKLTELEREAHGVDSLPGSLNEALEELEKSDVAKEALGEHIYAEFIKAKRREWDEHRTYVSPWEIERYMPRF
ncbi:MAG: type I glutamate--ammonia ligase [Vampirovibrionales bacterium]|nr:type I glutamate--ammonia ligase [Vampirovibrionales bacterium]